MMIWFWIFTLTCLFSIVYTVRSICLVTALFENKNTTKKQTELFTILI